jgi:hypothetical protein
MHLIEVWFSKKGCSLAKSHNVEHRKADVAQLTPEGIVYVPAFTIKSGTGIAESNVSISQTPKA